MRRQWGKRVSWVGVLILGLSSVVSAQQVLRGSIAGTVTDETGANLPGVTVTVTSPALQVPQILRVSGERGEYLIPELGAGTYRVSYELPGFATLVREGIILTTGFAARVDAEMKVATLAETVTVSGETPIVDVTSTRGGTTVSKDLIATIPGNLNYQDVLLLVGGTQGQLPPMTGDIRAGVGGGSGIKTYGATGSTNTIEGVKMNPNEVPDFTAFEEVDVKTFGNGADVDVPGASIQLVVKSGGNQFHGRLSETAQHKRFESNNLDDALRRQGVSAGDSILYYNDISGDIGGRIIRDKLWFYGGARDYRNRRTQIGYARETGPDKVYGTADDVPSKAPASHLSLTTKVSWQATLKHRFIYFWQFNPDTEWEARGDRFTPYESNIKEIQTSQEMKPIEWQGALSNKWVVTAMYATGGYSADYWFPEQYQNEWKGIPTRFDRTTRQNTGPSFHSTAVHRRGPTRDQLNGSVNYIPGDVFLGSHAFQAGYRAWWGKQNYRNPHDPPRNAGIGEYQLVYDTVAGRAHQPVEIVVKNVPVGGESMQNVFAGYLQDSWNLSRRVTVNLGMRWEKYIHFVPPQTKVQGRFGTSGDYPRIDAGTYSAFAPRTGVAFDLSGDGKTVVKGTYGWFNHSLNLHGYSLSFSQNNLVQYTYRWRDLDGNDDYTNGEVNLDVNGPDFLSLAGATTGTLVLNPDHKLPHTHEITASIERELGSGMSIRALYVHNKIVDDFQTVNIKRPYNVYNRVFSRKDPGGDGLLNTADDGGMVTLYDYDPAYRGAAFTTNMNINTQSDRGDTFKNIEIMLTKRNTGKWFANSSFLATKNHRWLVKVAQSPNDGINAIDETWDMSIRLGAGYSLPYGINLSTLYQGYSGLPRQRTYVFRAADPLGGPAFPSSSTITMRMEEFGATRGKPRHIANVRAAKDLRLGGSRKVIVSIDAFNFFNSNVAWGSPPGGGANGIDDVSGPTYGYVANVVKPRVLRFNVGYEF